jgi:L-malate glycosyltransferase
MPTRVALLTPFAFPSVRGNAVTVARIARGLRAAGVEVRVWDRSAADDPTIERELEAFRPALVHGFHAWRVGPLALRLARRAEIPLVVTLTGTDANHDLFDAERATTIRRVLEGAARVIVFDDGIRARVAAVLPGVAARIVSVPQAADLETGPPFALETAWPDLPARRVLFAFPAGIRPVKRPLMPLGALDAVAARHSDLRLVYAGPLLEPGESEALLAGVARRPWARYIGTVPHEAMASFLAQADVVLNCSVSEGGMANSVLEAQACGRAVLAADIEGNRTLVAHDVSGLLFRDEAELGAMAQRLTGDPALRARLGAAARDAVRAKFAPAREIDGHLAVYGALAIATRRCA